ncbi:MAG TPA: MBL fold metallo-hydrolase [Gaiellaceae bacterium]|jgi:L-ascorbate metabolism protein UlaG (beta-lactamase superfamily)|nr:MBL fold metallo-hydrolase [Gaiellaceae bacterium]
MRIRWYGQSAFLVEGEKRVFLDPFGDPAPLAARGIEFGYPPIAGVEADLLLVTHDHFDHNAVEAVGGEPPVLRSPGRHESPVGEVVGIASEHDGAAGTERGPNTIFVFSLDGLRICHLGDFGQPALRPEQRQAIGEVHVLFLPTGGGATVGGDEAAAVARELRPRLVVAMHYRTEAVNFLDPPDAFLEAYGARVERLETSEAEVEPLLGSREEPVVALLAPPLG